MSNLTAEFVAEMLPIVRADDAGALHLMAQPVFERLAGKCLSARQAHLLVVYARDFERSHIGRAQGALAALCATL